MIATAALMTVLVTTGVSQATGSVRHFQRAEKSIVPKDLLDSEYLCGGLGDDVESVKECEEDFKRIGAVWTGDVNDDGTQELVIYPGTAWSGSGGSSYFLFQRRGDAWISLLGDNWFTNNPEFDILPVMHRGYHDLRIAIDECVKWNGKQYEDYDANDYHNLSASFFDPEDWWNADIFWDIHYQGLKMFRLSPKWFVLPSSKDRSSANVTLDDPMYGLKWIAFFKGGVWGVRGKEAFLLVPQPAYQGAQKLEFQGDWLVVYGDLPVGAPLSVVARYNRRTNEVDLLTDIH